MREASKVTQGNQVYMDVTANKVTEVSKVSKVKQEYRARMGQTANKARGVNKAKMEREVKRDQKDL